MVHGHPVPRSLLAYTLSIVCSRPSSEDRDQPSRAGAIFDTHPSQFAASALLCVFYCRFPDGIVHRPSQNANTEQFCVGPSQFCPSLEKGLEGLTYMPAQSVTVVVVSSLSVCRRQMKHPR